VAHFLLLHGACHGGWCWDRVVSQLRDRGHSATAPDLPCDNLQAGLSEYADTAIIALGDSAESDQDVVVVAHSLGALVAPVIASRVPTRRLVMLAGIVGAPGASMEQLAAVDADRDLPLGENALEFDAQGRFRFAPDTARRLLYHDCSPADADAAVAQLRFQCSMWTQVADFAEWPRTEIVSITCLDDRVVNPTWSDRIARERLGVEPVHLPGGVGIVNTSAKPALVSKAWACPSSNGVPP
jgi:pimeloyl-ACP methyl ester carboxylesterase